MTEQTKTRFPAPLYAAAGAGDLAYEQLRKLPSQVAQLRAKVTELRPAPDTNLRADLDRLRDAAQRNAASILADAQAGVQTVQERAVAVYTGLVARGEKVVSTARGAETKIEIEAADKTVTTEVTTPPAASFGPAKKVSPAARKTTPAKE